MRSGCDNPPVLVEGHLYGERVWFSDTRGPVRRMGISTHPVDATIVISLWQGDVCTGTFRLPARDAAGVISTLAHGMTEAISDSPRDSDAASSPRGRSRPRLLRRLFMRTTSRSGTQLKLLK
jgi:hypothetical protein